MQNMENWMKQMRIKFAGTEPENETNPSSSRDQKISIQKTQSFKEKKRGQNWFQRQFIRKTSQDYDSRDIEHTTAVAAAAFAISSQERNRDEGPERSSSKTRSKVDGTKSPIFQSIRSKRSSDEKQPEKAITPAPSKKKTSSFRELLNTTPEIPPPVSSASFRPPNPPPFGQTSTALATGETEADAWKKAELEKIEEKYKNLKETIDAWENKKRKKSKSKMNKQESELDQGRVKAVQKFQNDIERIDKIARGARAQADARRRNEELRVEEKANRIRTTGRLPGPCFCF